MADDYGTVGLSEDLETDGAPIKYHFNYQATASFDITINWEFENAPTDPEVTITYQKLGESQVSTSSTSVGITGSFSTTLPSATFCYVSLELVGSGGGLLTTSLS